MCRSGKRGFQLVLLSAVLVLPAAAVQATWSSYGTSVGSLSELSSALFSDTEGGMVAVWKELTPNACLKVQRVDQAGNLVWSAPAVLTPTPFSTWGACSDGQGGAILCLDATADTQLLAQRFDGQGHKAWGDGQVLLVSASGTWPAVKTLVRTTDGQYVLAYSQNRGSYVQFYAIRLNAAGNAVGNPSGTTITSSANSKFELSVFPAPQGDAYFVWKEYDGTGNYYAQRFNAAGLPVWPQARCLTAGTNANNLDVAADVAGHLYGVYTFNMTVYANRIDPDGTTPWAQAVSLFPGSTGIKNAPRASFFQDGALLGAAFDMGIGPGDVTKRVQRVETSGALAWGTFGVAADHSANWSNTDILIPDTPYVWLLWPTQADEALSIWAKKIFPDGTVTSPALDSLQNFWTSSGNNFSCGFNSRGVLILLYNRTPTMGTPGSLYLLPLHLATALNLVMVPANTYYNGETDQPVMNLQLSAVAEDRLNSFRVCNTKSALCPADIRRCSLWRQGTSGPFDPLQAVLLDRLKTQPDGKTYVSSGTYVPATIAAADQLFVTADIAQTLTPGRYCQFSLPANGAVWDSFAQLPGADLTNPKSQYLTELYNLKCTGTGLLAGHRLSGEKSVKVFKLAFSNASNSDCNLQQLRLNVQDGLGKPLAAASWVSAWRVNGQPAQAVGVQAGAFTLSFAAPLLIPVFGQASLEVEMDLADNLPAGTLQFQIPAQGFLDPSGQTVAVDLSDGVFPLGSGVVKIVLPNAESSLSVYPNPAVLSQGPATLSVFLEGASAVDVGIYTLDGSLVRQVAKGEPHPRGQTSWSWDGANDAGRRVLSGVYWMRLGITQDGRTRVLTKKIAVAR